MLSPAELQAIRERAANDWQNNQHINRDRAALLAHVAEAQEIIDGLCAFISHTRVCARPTSYREHPEWVNLAECDCGLSALLSDAAGSSLPENPAT